MPNYWLVKTEPSTYSFDDLKREGVANYYPALDMPE